MTVADASGLLPVYAQTVHIADSPRSGCIFKRRDVDGGVMMVRWKKWWSIYSLSLSVAAVFTSSIEIARFNY